MSVYNTQKYVRQAMDSLLAQTLDGLELLLIDDGSTDGSGQILEEYAKAGGSPGNGARIRVIHKANGGLAQSRNLGVREAMGAYVGFFDPDDWAEPDMYERLYGRAAQTGADVVLCGFNEVYEGEKRTEAVRYPFLDDSVSRGEQVRRVYLANNITGRLHSFAWNKLYKRAVLLDRQIVSPEEMPLMQDSVFAIRLFSKVDSAGYLDDRPYYFRRHANSNTMKYRPDIFEMARRIYLEKMAALENSGLMEPVIRSEVCGWFMMLCKRAVFAEVSGQSPNTPPRKEQKLRDMADDREFCEAYDLLAAQNKTPSKIVSLLREKKCKEALKTARYENLKAKFKTRATRAGKFFGR